VAQELKREFWVEEEKTKYSIEWKLDENEEIDAVEVEKTWYPIYPYGNYVKRVIRVWWAYDSKLPLCIEVFKVRMSWNGTGRDDVLSLCFNDYSPETPSFLWNEMIESINSAEDVKNYVKKVAEWLNNLINDTISFV